MKRRKKKRGMKAVCVDAAGQESAVRAAAAKVGLTLLVVRVRCGRTCDTLHWMFDEAGTGRRVADYWPGSGTLRVGGVSSKVASPDEALAAAGRSIAGAVKGDAGRGRQAGRPDEDAPPATAPALVIRDRETHALLYDCCRAALAAIYAWRRDDLSYRGMVAAVARQPGRLSCRKDGIVGERRADV